MGLLDPPAPPVFTESKYRRRGGPRDIFFIGSSSIARGSEASYAGHDKTQYGYFTNLGYVGWAQIQGNGLWRYAGQAATGGYSAMQVRDEHLPAALAAKPWACVVHCGQNNIESWEDTLAALTTIYQSLLAARIMPILVTIQPLDNASDKIKVNRLNTWIKARARDMGVPVLDSHALFVNPETNAWATAYSDGDQVHSNGLGAKVLGKLLNDTLAPWLPATGAFDFAASEPDTSLLVSRPLNYVTSGSFTSGWSGTLGTGAAATKTDQTGVVGKMMTITYDGSGSAATTIVGPTVTLVAGRRYRLGFKSKLVLPGAGRVTFRLAQQPASTEDKLFGFRAEQAYDLGQYVQEWTMPAGLSSYAFRPAFTLDGTPASGFAFSFGQFTWQDMTAQTTI